MNPPTTLTNHNPPATIGCGLNPNPIRREESDTPHCPTHQAPLAVPLIVERPAGETSGTSHIPPPPRLSELQPPARSPRRRRRLTLTDYRSSTAVKHSAHGTPTPATRQPQPAPSISPNTDGRDGTDSIRQPVADEEKVAARATAAARLRQPVPNAQVSTVLSRMAQPVVTRRLKRQGLP